MKSFVISSLAGAIAACAVVVGAAGCDGGAGPASPPFDPIGGTEPTAGGGDSPGGAGASLPELCAQACANILAACPSLPSGTDCAAQCVTAAADAPACASVFKSFVACLATTTLVCSNNTVQAPQCNSEMAAINSCSSQSTSGGTGSGGAAGMAGTAGTTGAAPAAP